MLSVRFEAGQWWLIDQQSTHGLYVNGRQIARLLLQQAVTIELGLGGPTVWLAVGDEVPFFDQPSDVAQAGDQLPSVTEIVERWKRGDTAAEGEEARRYRESGKAPRATAKTSISSRCRGRRDSIVLCSGIRMVPAGQNRSDENNCGGDVLRDEAG